MFKISLKLLLIITLLLTPQKETNKLVNNKVKTNYQYTSNNKYNYKEAPIGTLIINKINLKKELYDINSKNNTIEKNITILKGSIDPSYNNSIFFIAAHSGSGKLAFFKNLEQLQINDKIILIYKNKKYTYHVNKIWEQKKSSYIDVYKNTKKQLILTTCSPTDKNKQLIINSIIKES